MRIRTEIMATDLSSMMNPGRYGADRNVSAGRHRFEAVRQFAYSMLCNTATPIEILRAKKALCLSI